MSTCYLSDVPLSADSEAQLLDLLRDSLSDPTATDLIEGIHFRTEHVELESRDSDDRDRLIHALHQRVRCLGAGYKRNTVLPI